MYPASSFIFVGVFAALSFLAGFAVLSRVAAGQLEFSRLLAIPVGAGLVICLLFLLAVAGALMPLPLVLTAVGLALASWLACRGRIQEALGAAGSYNRVSLMLLAVLLAYTAYAALGVPLEWDELSYHLPYARDYAESGSLVVSEYLRFPLHTHNVHLLYAVALIFSDETATHLLHALSGVLVAVGMVSWCRANLTYGVGIVAAALYVGLSATYYDTAYVDLTLGLFVFYAFFALSAWQETREPGFLLASAFLLAMAAGTKYQGLVQLVVFFFALLAITRSASVFARVALVLLLFGTWWYIRNLLVSGDPIHPMGARLFGYWLWNESDLAGQLGNISTYRDHLHWVLVPALGSVWLVRSMNARYRSLVIVGLGGLLIWYLTSRYQRYLLPTLPFLAILSVHVSGHYVRTWTAASRLPEVTRKRLVLVLLVLLSVVAVADIVGKWADTCFTRSCIDKVYERELFTAQAARSVPGFRRLALYQMGLENELYLLGKPVFGDWFGPYRYNDLIALGGDGEATAAHLKRIGADSLIINKTLHQFQDLLENDRLDEVLIPVYEDRAVILYQLPESHSRR
jgi:hypothetical protein